MGRLSNIYATCCVCAKGISRNYQYITEYSIKRKNYQKYDKEAVTILDILDNLGLLSFEIENVQNSVICSHCKKIVLEFFDFKMMMEKKQKNLEVNEGDTQIDTIKKYLRPNHYDTLKDYIVNNIVVSIEITAMNELIIRSKELEIKTEKIPGIDFIDPNVQVKRKDINDEFFDDTKIDASEKVQDDSHNKSEESDSDDDDDIAQLQEPFEEDDMEEGISKTVVDNIQFISRIPVCFENLEDKTKEVEATSIRKSANSSNLERIRQKIAKAKGQSYISKTGKLMKARKMQPPCGSTCRYECSKRIPNSDRQKHFESYWNLGDFALQKKFIFQHRRLDPVLRRQQSKSNSNATQKSYSSKYFLDTFNEDGSIKSQERVCETMFVNTFDINKNSIRTLNQKVLTGKVEDLRGQSQRKHTEGHLTAIDHAQQFPYFHIEQQMSVQQIYKGYTKVCEEKKIKPVSIQTYRNIFSNYNMTDFLKEKRTVKCEICFQYLKASEEQKPAMQCEIDQHIKENKQCRDRIRHRRNRLARIERKNLMKMQNSTSTLRTPQRKTQR